MNTSDAPHQFPPSTSSPPPRDKRFSADTLYPVNEIFPTLQGEATFTGTPSLFIRLQGCPVGCAWCDTKHTWGLPGTAGEQRAGYVSIIPLQQVRQPDHAQPNTGYHPMSVADLAYEVQNSHLHHVVITGGEPCLYDLMALTTHLLAIENVTVQVETSGTHPIKVAPGTWVTLSPKIRMPGKLDVLHDSVLLADEIKHPVAIERNVLELEELLREVGLTEQPAGGIWLQPVYQAPRGRDVAMRAAMERNWRVSFQMHKMAGIP
jgi:7-carboxy-7-deazaguanine synthase